MYQKIINFVKYHNAFTIGVMLILIFSSVMAASPTAREKVIGKAVVEKQGIDNSVLLSADLDNFDFQLKITNVKEDEENYYIDYQFVTLDIKDNAWQKILRQSHLKVSKSALAGQDLGLYVQKQLGEVADSELAYLKKVQAKEKEKGKTKVVETKKYTGLIGLSLDIKNKILPGYEPVVKPPKPKMVISQQPQFTEAGPPQTCQPNWQCSDWQPAPSDVATGTPFTQTRTCTDLNNCGISQGKPAETRNAIGTYVTSSTVAAGGTGTDSGARDEMLTSDVNNKNADNGTGNGSGTSGGSGDAGSSDASGENGTSGGDAGSGSQPATTSPEVSLTASTSTCATGTEITFTATTSNFATTTLTYAWDFGDSATTTATSTDTDSTTHTYNATATYTVSVTATAGTQTASTSTTVEITTPDVKENPTSGVGETCASSTLQYCTTSDACLGAGGFWHKTCTSTNSAPVAQDISISVKVASSTEINLSAEDADGDNLTYTIISQPTIGTLSGAPPNLTYTPNATGTDFFTYKASDGYATSNEATVNITISE